MITLPEFQGKGHAKMLFDNIEKLCKEKKYSEGSGPCSTHPHNFYVQLLAETGLVGFSLLFSAFLFLIFSITRHLLGKIIYKKILFSDYQICLLSGIFILLIIRDIFSLLSSVRKRILPFLLYFNKALINFLIDL